MKLHWGNAIFIFFAIFLSLSIFFIVFSFRQNIDLVDDNYYEKGAAYTTQIETNKRSVFFTDSIHFTASNGLIYFTFCDSITKNSKLIKIFLYRPSNKDYDYKTSWKIEENSFIVDKSKLHSGRYIAKINWRMNNQDYELNKTLFVD